MSIAALTQWISVSRPREGQARLGQRCLTSPSGFTTCDAAERAVGRHLPGHRARPVLACRPDDLRDHVAGPLHDHEVALADVLAVDVLLVVERRGRDGDAADLHRLELGPRVQRARAADPDVDLAQGRDRGRRRPLVRARPPGPLVERAEPLLLLEGVELDHDRRRSRSRALRAALSHRAQAAATSSIVSSRSVCGFVRKPRSRSHASISNWAVGAPAPSCTPAP